MAYRKKYKRGVPAGYKHIWGYRGVWTERKGKDGIWRGNFRATKGHKGRKSYGNFKKGFKIKWKLWGTQTATKTGKGTYQTNFKFKKKRISSGYKKRY